ncbi:hypothetical protein NONI108955_29285 [Nocardia ninae]|uniref:Uncharacterized protein n=1 Tax=Nocardia ninae NBRC 108245 TaxID=1210091 RepID=A0A511MKK1_9NOCA|nr:hypothetical protein NN4_56810 [Nocardia ninae NBRC 108245]
MLAARIMDTPGCTEIGMYVRREVLSTKRSGRTPNARTVAFEGGPCGVHVYGSEIRSPAEARPLPGVHRSSSLRLHLLKQNICYISHQAPF